MARREFLDRSALGLFAALVFSIAAHAQSQERSLEELETARLIDQASRAFGKRDLSIEEMSAEFRYRCLRAVGDPTYCECLVARRPYTLRFEHYIGISSRTRSELEYDTLSEHGRQIVDKVYAVRGECVGR
jgi:hypothetical protein